MQLASPAPVMQQQQQQHQQQQQQQHQLQVTDDTSLMLLMLEREDKLRTEAKAEKVEQEAKAKAREDELRQEMHQEMDKLREEMQPPDVADEQIAALQVRLEAIHAAKLLSDDELDALEDTLMEYVEVKASSTMTSGEMHAAASRLSKLVAVSEAVVTDGVFARQARRRFVSSHPVHGV